MDVSAGLIVLVAALVIVVLFLFAAVKIAREYERGVIFRLGRLLPEPKGPGLFLLHGFPVTSAMWEPLIAPAAAAGYRVIAFDQRGYSPGARPAGVDAYRVDRTLEDVLAVADAAGFERFHLVGHDWGCVVGWRAAVSHLEQVAAPAYLLPYARLRQAQHLVAARERVGAREVLAKINDPVRAAAYAELGLTTVCRTTMIADAINTHLGLPVSGQPGVHPSSGTHSGHEHDRARRDRVLAGGGPGRPADGTSQA